ncbi:MAG: DUF547 domain-containing protein [Gemmatimonadetes bacterium]|nr:DUF547 domain-containing protein [Gemmatimonadota bacterium]MYE70785.1 DUF547 domain-containing protein [Gemmatimonadota bacterium]MYJ67710.1 DUF547 domain-containing protein [Gemmatimonadota bacterium]
MAEVTSNARRAGPLMKLGLLAVFPIGVFLIARLTPLGAYLTRDGIFQFIDWLSGHPWAPVIFVALYAGATALAVPGTILTFAGGAVFGFWWGTLLNMFAANIGANAAFLLARTLGRDGVRSLMGDDSRALEKLDNVVGRHGFQGLLTLRLIPLVPFNALNFGSGLMPLTWRTYALATLIGIVPGTAIYTFFADSLLEGSREASTQALVQVFIAGGLLVLLSFLPALLKRLGIRLPGMGALVLLCAGAAATRGAAAQEPASGLPDHSAFTAVLASVVTDAGVDYAALAADPSGLERYIAELEATDPNAVAGASREERLAFWINAYNACMLKRVVSHYPIRSARGLRGVRNAVSGRPANSVWQIGDVFTGAHCPVAGAERSQDEIEHEIIRPMGEPRIHFAINCAAVSCPPLIREAYRAETLEEQLDSRVMAFVRDPLHFGVDNSGGQPVVRVNELLNWFSEDFGGHDGVRAFLAGHVQGAAREALEDPGVRLVFTDYDWTLNDIPK